MKNFTGIFFLLFIYSYLCSAQDWVWVKQFGSNGANDNDIAEICLSANNEIYVFFQCRTTGDKFYINSDSLYINQGNFFLAKLNSSGDTIWIKQAQSPNVSCYHSSLNIIYSNFDNSIYLHGSYCTSMESFCGYQFPTAQFDANFLSKYDSSGNCLWSKIIDSTSYDFSDAWALDDSGNIFMSGEHWYPVMYDTIQANAGTVISKFDANGRCTWTKNICLLTNDGLNLPQLRIHSMNFQNGFIFISGYESNDTVTINSVTHSHPGLRGSFNAKLAMDGQVIWYKESLGAEPYVTPFADFNSLELDKNGNVYSTFHFQDSCSFDGHFLYGGPQPSPVGINYELVFLKYDSTGNLLWFKQFHAGNISLWSGIQTDSNGYTYLTSGFTDSIDFDGQRLYPTANQEMYLARFSPNGNYLGVKHFGDAAGINLAVDNNNDVIVLSQLNGSTTVDQQTYDSYSGPNGQDLLISKCSEITGIEETGKKGNFDLLIYANPTNGKCNITIPDEFKMRNTTLTLSLFDNSGKVIRSYPVKMKEGTIKLDLEYEAEGIYLVTLSDGTSSYRGRIIFE